VTFPVLTTLIPMLGCVLALMGLLDLETAWTGHLAPEVRENLSPAAFKIVDTFVRQTSGAEQRALWLIIGLPVMVWQASAAVRALTDALCRIYRIDERRSGLRQWVVSFALGFVSCVLLVLAFGILRFTPALTDGAVLPALRWPVAFVLLSLLIGLLVHYAPERQLPMRWASTGSLFCVASWLLVSGAFAFYATQIVDYGSIFPTLALVFVTLIYLWLSVSALLVGAQLDAVIRQERTGSRSGVSKGAGRRRANAATPRPVK
jgi:membrane protein